MSEAAEQAAAPEGPSAGALLRQAREAVGLHVATLAVALKVPVRKLEALEADRYDLLPDAVFARALASSVCRHLKIDPRPILERLPQGPAPRLVPDTAAINAPFRAPGDGPGPSWLDHLSRPVSLAVIALLLGAVVIILLPTTRRDEGVAVKSETVKSEPVMPPGSPTTIAVAPAEPVASAAAVPASSVVAASAPKSPAPPPAVAPVVAAPAPVAASSAAAAPRAAAPAATASAPGLAASGPQTAGPVPTSGTVVFKTRAPSWVQVTDAKGNVVLRRLMEAGETAGASGALPLAVVVGSAESTTVEVRGKPYNLAPVSRDNVARFDVK
jgi:cytoskeleton protein RodZ